MTASKTRPNRQPSPTKAEREWLRTVIRSIRMAPELVHPPTLLEVQMSEKYKLDISGPADAAGMQRSTVKMFCESMTPQRFTYYMRDDRLRSEMRELMKDVPVVREGFAEQQPAFLGLIDIDPPTTLHLASLDGQSLY